MQREREIEKLLSWTVKNLHLNRIFYLLERERQTSVNRLPSQSDLSLSGTMSTMVGIFSGPTLAANLLEAPIFLSFLLGPSDF